MIEEPEIRELFAAEAAEILERMERALIALEQAPQERALIETVFRQAHSLKGSAASLGLHQVESVAHRFEDALDAARHGRHQLTPERADQLYRAVDALRGLVEESVTGRPSGVDFAQTLLSLEASTPAPERTTAEGPSLAAPDAPVAETVSATDDDVAMAAVVDVGASESAGLGAAEEIDAATPQAAEKRPTLASPSPTVSEEVPATVRVETVRLDRALAGTGDLVVTSARLAIRRAEAVGLREAYETWARAWRLRGMVSPRQGERIARFGADLEQLIVALADDQARLQYITDHLREEIQEMRLVPLSGMFGRFRRMVRDLARREGKEIQLLVEGEETTADRRLLEYFSSPLTHLVRNAVDHGIEPARRRERLGKPKLATLRLSARRRGAMLEVTLSDDGAGLNFEAIRQRAKDLRLRSEEQLAQASDEELAMLIFTPGFSTSRVVSELSGRGTGLDAVRTVIEGLGGTANVESKPGQGSVFRLRAPLTLAISQVMVCSCGDRLYAVPLMFVERSLLYDSSKVFFMEGRPCLEVEGELLPVSRLDALLGGSSTGAATCLVLSDRTERHGFLVEELLGVMEIVVKPFHESSLVGGASILPDGRVCLLLQSAELLRLTRTLTAEQPPGEAPSPSRAVRKGLVLLAEDSPTVAARAATVLKAAGYQVCLVGDGTTAWKKACEQRFDAVVSDIEMPGLSGFELSSRLRGLASYADVPILLVTALNDEESRLTGLEAGASAYLEKSAIDDGVLISLLERLL